MITKALWCLLCLRMGVCACVHISMYVSMCMSSASPQISTSELVFQVMVQRVGVLFLYYQLLPQT